MYIILYSFGEFVQAWQADKSFTHPHECIAAVYCCILLEYKLQFSQKINNFQPENIHILPTSFQRPFKC